MAAPDMDPSSPRCIPGSRTGRWTARPTPRTTSYLAVAHVDLPRRSTISLWRCSQGRVNKEAQGTSGLAAGRRGRGRSPSDRTRHRIQQTRQTHTRAHGTSPRIQRSHRGRTRPQRKGHERAALGNTAPRRRQARSPRRDTQQTWTTHQRRVGNPSTPPRCRRTNPQTTIGLSWTVGRRRKGSSREVGRLWLSKRRLGH